MDCEIRKEELESEIAPIRDYAAAVVVKTDDDNMKAADYLRKIKTAQKAVKDKFKPVIEKAYQAHKALKAFESEFLDPLNAAEAKIKSAMISFEREAEAERRRLQDLQEAEARRIESEARKLAEQSARAEARGREEQALAKADAAAAIQQRAEEVRQTVIEKPMTKNAGISYVTSWRFEVVSPADVPMEYRMIDERKIAAVVRATKGALAIPGVRIWSEKTVASRGF